MSPIFVQRIAQPATSLIEPHHFSRRQGTATSPADLMIKETPEMSDTVVDRESADQPVQASSFTVADRQLNAVSVDRMRTAGLHM
jgi:hypothetical protein